MKAFFNDNNIKPQDVIQACLKENLITAYKGGKVYSHRANKFIGSSSARGYSVCSLHYRGIKKQVKIHQIIWIEFNGPIPSGLIIDHIDRNKKNNALSNLRLVTQKQNSNNRRSYRGTANPAAKTCLEEAREIRRLHDHGLSYSHLANAFWLSKSLVALIVRRELWV